MSIYIDEYLYSDDDGKTETEIIDKLTKPLFPSTHLYGVTINVQPTRHINKKQWKKYTHDQQRAILSRMENSIRRNTPSIELLELHYEVCPTLQNIHFHGLYRMPEAFVTEMECQWNRLVGTIVTKTTRTDPEAVWRHIDIKKIIDGPKQWIDYIRKDLPKEG